MAMAAYAVSMVAMYGHLGRAPYEETREYIAARPPNLPGAWDELTAEAQLVYVQRALALVNKEGTP